MTTPAYPSVDEFLGRLRRAGWSVGHVGGTAAWIVTGSNGENVVNATGATLAEAYWRACVQARELGLLAAARDAGPRGGHRP